MRHWSVDSFAPEQTQSVGELLGRLLVPPAVVLLVGDLGAGKTCLVKGLARGFGISEQEPVTSPTFTLLNIYAGRSPLFHFDLYRLSQEEDLLDLGFDEYLQAEGVTVVEWADRIAGLEAQTGDLVVHLRHAGDDRRQIAFEARQERAAQWLDRLASAWLERGSRK
ncbi:MAG: tRNA (adenosine(37)-N6)-threonylcarbamoyltransferase complex ATPase subunit type 1 TsaE [Desulfuromonadales bacterium]|nr:tRNA (adenosine(37)-N6)-threonylcarbamoyltransferase complex ATPase subunit type 1 TsaE [Desulfuromonadales bacterium]